MLRNALLLVILIASFSKLFADGNVNVSVDNDGDIKVIGDSSNNNIHIFGGGGSLLTIKGLDGTTVNGGTQFAAYMSRDLIVDSGIGLDEIALEFIKARTYTVTCPTGLPQGPHCNTRPRMKRIIMNGGQNGPGNSGSDILTINQVITDIVIASNFEQGFVEFSGFRSMSVSDINSDSFFSFARTRIGENLYHQSPNVEGGLEYSAGNGNNSLNFSNGYYANVKVTFGSGDDHLSMNAEGTNELGVSYWEMKNAIYFFGSFDIEFGGFPSGNDKFTASVGTSGGYIVAFGDKHIDGGQWVSAACSNCRAGYDHDIAELSQLDVSETINSNRIFFYENNFENFESIID